VKLVGAREPLWDAFRLGGEFYGRPKKLHVRALPSRQRASGWDRLCAANLDRAGRPVVGAIGAENQELAKGPHGQARRAIWARGGCRVGLFACFRLLTYCFY
jgi:hypothetical protein